MIALLLVVAVACLALLAVGVWLLLGIRATVRTREAPSQPLFGAGPSPEVVRMLSRAHDEAIRRGDVIRRGALRHVEYDGPTRQPRHQRLA